MMNDTEGIGIFGGFYQKFEAFFWFVKMCLKLRNLKNYKVSVVITLDGLWLVVITGLWLVDGRLVWSVIGQW